ncbi:MAG: hypothetical protein QXF26_05120 [Candidatus Bathyarchaeia archaeon]
MRLELKVNQVLGLPNGMVRIILLRRGLKARVEPIPKTEEEKVAQKVISQVSQALSSMFPGGVIIGGQYPAGASWDARIEMDVTSEEYEQMGKPGINDTLIVEVSLIQQPSSLY